MKLTSFEIGSVGANSDTEDVTIDSETEDGTRSEKGQRLRSVFWQLSLTAARHVRSPCGICWRGATVVRCTRWSHGVGLTILAEAAIA
jgi:hypothetical protein